MNTIIVDVVERAVRLALGLSWFPEYTRWAEAWLDGSNRTRESATVAKARINQWQAFGGVHDFSRACFLAAKAAEELAWSKVNEAEVHARAAIVAALRASEPPSGPDCRPQDELIIGEEEFSPGPVIRGPNHYPRVRSRED